MPSPAEYAANRLKSINNESANHSSSPPTASGRTQEGRTRSSMNALRHGLTARVVVLPSEDMAAYQAFSKEIVDSLDAQTPVERQFAQTVADNQWRINRIRSIEDGMLAMGHFEAAGDFDASNPEIHSAMTAAKSFRAHSQAFVNLSIYEQSGRRLSLVINSFSQAFVNLSIYEQRLHRSMKESLRQLKELQSERRERRKAEMDDAIRLLKLQEMKGLPYDPAADDFVYASAEIAAEVGRRARHEESLLAEKAGFNLDKYTAFAPTLVPPVILSPVFSEKEAA